MSRHHFDACDCCLKEILEDDPSHYTSVELASERIEQVRGKDAIVIRKRPRRDLCESCYCRVTQALVQAPESLWLLEGFEVMRK